VKRLREGSNWKKHQKEWKKKEWGESELDAADAVTMNRKIDRTSPENKKRKKPPK